MVTDKLVGPKVKFPSIFVASNHQYDFEGADLCDQVPTNHLRGRNEAEPRGSGGDARQRAREPGVDLE